VSAARPVRINGYPIDVAITEGHQFDSEVTKYPVEQGSDVSDNIRNLPVVITLEGVVSDTPIGAIALDQTRRPEAGSAAPSVDAYQRIIAIRDEKEPIEIETSLGKFDSMVLTSLGITRDRDTGKALRFTAQFEQVIIKKNARITVRVSVPNCSGMVNGGNRQPLLGKNGKDVGSGFDSIRRWVRSNKVSLRTQLRPTMGSPILTTTRAQRLSTGGKTDPFSFDEMDHYPVSDGKVTEYADGYVSRGPDHKDVFFAMSVNVDRFGRAHGQGGGVTEYSTKVGDQEVYYDYASNSWKRQVGDTRHQNDPVVKKVPPGEDKWNSVTRTRLPSNRLTGGQ